MQNPLRINVEQLVSEIESSIRSSSPASTAVLRDIRRRFSKRLAKEPAEAVIRLARRLLKRPTMERRFVAYELVPKHRAALGSLRARDLNDMGRGIDHWGAVDCFACYLAGPAWRARQVPESLIHGWARSKDRWWRRAALVSTVPLNIQAQGGNGDAVRTLAVCRLLVADRDDMVVKALSWALRALANCDAHAVRTFVELNRDGLAARVLREVRNKLATGLKNPRR